MEEISTPTLFIVQLVLLLLPGFIWAQLDNKYASRLEESQLWFLLRAVIFGVMAHVAAWFLYWSVHQDYELVDLGKAQTAEVITGRVGLELVIASACAIVLAIAWMYAINYKLFTRFLQWIRATRTYGDEDVWDYALNSSAPEARYVHVRDFENEIAYAGWVNLFSESGKLRELLLTDVQVYDFEGELLFTSPSIYLARKPESIHMEFPATGENVSGDT